MPRVEVNLPEAPARRYAIEIEAGRIGHIGSCLRPHARSNRVFLVQDAAVESTHGKSAADSLRASGFEVHGIALIADETSKSLASVERLYQAMRDAKLDRTSLVVAIGGGIVGDIAGFAAATYMRGLPCVQVPTTLLAMVDAAIGGKTGVNLTTASQLVKNLVGAFHQPLMVIADPSTLHTLSERHFRCGLAECIKHAMIDGGGADRTSGGQRLMPWLIENLESILQRNDAVITELVTRCAEIKVRIVERDERETADPASDPSGGRAVLNLGHTFAHAFEAFPQLNLLHGEAVSIGLIAAMRCAVLTRRMNEAQAFPCWKLLHDAGLPVRLPSPISSDEILHAMSHDKKVAAGMMRLVVPLGAGGAVLTDDVPLSVIHSALSEIAAR